MTHPQKTRRPRCLLAIAALLAPWAVVVPAQQPDSGAEDSDAVQRSLMERSRRMVAHIRELGPWDEQARLINRAGDNVFRTYGWNSEADRFAHELMREITGIPPWEFSRRFQRAHEMISDRYQFSSEQGAQIQQKVMLRMFQYFGRHAPELFELSEEILSARSQGRPFTTAEVARWSRIVEPLMVDGLDVYERICREVDPLLNDQQREILARDRASELGRARAMLSRMEEWKQGEWKPEDWGLQDDPFHQKNRPPMQAGNPAGPPEPEGPIPQIDPADQDAWVRYVRRFMVRYTLDQEQRNAAQAILQDVRTQASVYRSADTTEADAGGADERMTRVYVRLFEQLKRRLETVPTSKQRSAAEAGPVRESRPAEVDSPSTQDTGNAE